jgi:signal transduction histidine kinase
MSHPGKIRTLRSLRSRILLLASLVCILLTAALTGFVLLLRQTQSTIIADSSSHLLNVVNTFGKDYLGAATSSPDVLSILKQAPGPRVDEALRPFTVNAYRRDPGIEGGFYSLSTGSLLGYAYPTNDGPGPKEDIPPLERPTILSIAQRAAATGRPSASAFRGQKDVILFQAVPLQKDGRVIGSVWGMLRIHDVDAGRNLQALFGLSSLALAAMVCVGVAFWITRNVQEDVDTIQGRLHDLEHDLSEPSRGDISTAELDVILRGINRLGVSLQEKIAKERQLVEQLHHKERLASLGQVAAGVAHELRNPLATIRLRTQMSLRSKDAEQLDHSAKLILEEIDRLSAVLDRLLYFSKPIKLQVKSFDPGQLCGDVLDVLKPEADRASVTLKLVASSGGTITADSLKLRQVLENLIRNALDAFDKLEISQKTVSVSVFPTPASVIITVQDNGVGVIQDVASKVFDPFFTTKARGTGLGLSIANEIVRAHGGSLCLKVGQPRGTIAELSLPRISGSDYRQGDAG